MENQNIKKIYEKTRLKSQKRVRKNKKTKSEGSAQSATRGGGWERAKWRALSPHPSDRWEAPEGALAN